ncbi:MULTISPECIES: HNH endonuclease [Halomonadaceae]|jgi:5-methylcytosine-specific restriction enzyme A|uniref:HNH endonuclease n=1 Tax=Halomonadaceae TaxID=28256 RepID=UPI0012F33A2B|nr:MULTISPECIES: HNH endonuclease signature motif containing protein [Halomonas]MCE7516673.1 HNH endonuclease [Halomonas titanicae]CAD5270293.1 HNH endonuclease [Halomonas sp. 156]CAD5280360.1 HNH endonuclease [Halomonas sp. 113]CAD5281849.1 HNH endonuclease [Halomonas sp. 59]CAD5287898.1 HNH endonuclease [Halomonas sp. I3]
MDSISSLKPGTVLSNQELSKIFKCSEQGGMRRSHKTNTLVLVMNHVKSIYDDQWIGDVVHYTGMGQLGEMSLTFQQNKTLNESPANGVAVHLFEVFKTNEYTYIGEVERVAPPYQATQPDNEGKPRQAWLFPLRLKSADVVPIDEVAAIELAIKKERRARKLSNKDLRARAENAPAQVGSRVGQTTFIPRSPYIAAYAKRRANGHCELCQQPAPFETRKGEPYLECHHIKWLSKGGDDSIENTVALCPNCHRKMHALNLEIDIIALTSLAT